MQVPLVFQVDKSFFRGVCVIGKKGDGGDVEVAVPVEVARHGLVGPVEREEPGLRKLVFTIVQEDADAVVFLQHLHPVAIVSCRVEDVQEPVIVEIGQFKTARTPGGRKFQQLLLAEAVVAIVPEHENAFIALCHQRNDILVAIAVEIMGVAADGARFFLQRMFLHPVAAQVLVPVQRTDVPAEFRDHDVRLLIVVQIRKIGIYGANQFVYRCVIRPDLGGIGTKMHVMEHSGGIVGRTQGPDVGQPKPPLLRAVPGIETQVDGRAFHLDRIQHPEALVVNDEVARHCVTQVDVPREGVDLHHACHRRMLVGLGRDSDSELFQAHRYFFMRILWQRPIRSGIEVPIHQLLPFCFREFGLIGKNVGTAGESLAFLAKIPVG